MSSCCCHNTPHVSNTQPSVHLVIFVMEISHQFALVRSGDGSCVVAVRSKDQHYHFPIVFPLPWTSHDVTWHFVVSI